MTRPVTDVAVDAGTGVFFSDLAVHSSYPNTSGAERMSLISTYRNAGVPDDSKVWEAGIPVGGHRVAGGVKPW